MRVQAVNSEGVEGNGVRVDGRGKGRLGKWLKRELGQVVHGGTDEGGGCGEPVPIHIFHPLLSLLRALE